MPRPDTSTPGKSTNSDPKTPNHEKVARLRPYIAGGAYLQRMGSWWSSAKVAQEDAFTGAYWEFLDRNEPQLADNHRLAIPLAQMRKRRES